MDWERDRWLIGVAVDASTTRLRLGVETSWSWQGAEGTSIAPTLPTALRYDTGDAETGLGVEVAAGVAYADPWPGADVVGGCEGLLSRQEGEGGMGFREWGGSGSIRYERGGDDLGLTVALSPSWGGSRADQLLSELAPSFPTAKGDDSTDGNRDWRLGSRLSFLPGLDISIEGTRRENENAAPDHGIHLNLKKPLKKSESHSERLLVPLRCKSFQKSSRGNADLFQRFLNTLW